MTEGNGHVIDPDGDARRALQEAVAQHGPEVLSDAAVVDDICREHLAGLPGESILIGDAARTNVPALLGDLIPRMGNYGAIQSAAASLAGEHNLDMAASLWVVREFARALGYIAAPTGTSTSFPGSGPRAVPVSGPATGAGRAERPAGPGGAAGAAGAAGASGTSGTGRREPGDGTGAVSGGAGQAGGGPGTASRGSGSQVTAGPAGSGRGATGPMGSGPVSTGPVGGGPGAGGPGTGGPRTGGPGAGGWGGAPEGALPEGEPGFPLPLPAARLPGRQSQRSKVFNRNTVGIAAGIALIAGYLGVAAVAHLSPFPAKTVTAASSSQSSSPPATTSSSPASSPDPSPPSQFDILLTKIPSAVRSQNHCLNAGTGFGATAVSQCQQLTGLAAGTIVYYLYPSRAALASGFSAFLKKQTFSKARECITNGSFSDFLVECRSDFTIKAPGVTGSIAEYVNNAQDPIIVSTDNEQNVMAVLVGTNDGDLLAYWNQLKWVVTS